jgi:hypothetical protein
MSGYLQPGTNMHIDLIHPSSANPLANYYKNVGTVYFPEIPVTSYPGLPGGDSDHTSFNLNGYMGIFPFEDKDNCSPFIHSSNDIIGLSVNTPEQVKLFTQMNLASIATLAQLDTFIPPSIVPPTNCLAVWVEEETNINNNILITWDEPEKRTPLEYFVYRDDESITQTADTQYLDTLEVPGSYCYKIIAIYEEGQSDFSNESCEAIPWIDDIMEYSSKFKIYPNPATGELRIENRELRIESVEIFDVYGRKHSILQSFQPSNFLILNVSHLPAGIYFIRIADEMAGKFVKE